MHFKLLTVSLMMAVGVAGLAVPEASNRTGKSYSVYVLDPARYLPYDDRVEPEFPHYDQPIEYSDYVRQFVSPPVEFFQGNVQPDAIASQIREHDFHCFLTTVI